MKYADWRHAFTGAAGGDAKRSAQLWNLEHERRIGKARGQFKRAVAREHDKALGAGLSPDNSAEIALDEAIKQTDPVDSRWLGLLPVPDGSVTPPTVMTFLSSSTLARYYSAAHLNPKAPPPKVQLSRPINTKSGKGGWTPIRRFIWVTFETDEVTPPSEDPVALKRELGLPHFRPDDYAYRCTLGVEPGQSRLMPTCLDARLYHAWAPPPPGHSAPWGLTRDLSTGESLHPELLLETHDYLDDWPTAILVSPPGGPPVAVGHVSEDYMAGR